MLRFAIALLFILVSGCAAQAPWEKIDAEQQAAAYTNLGKGYLEQEQTTRALQNFRKALKARSSYSAALHGTALALQQQGEMELSEKYYKKALQSKDHQTEIRNDYAAFLFNQNRYDEARKQLEKASEDIYYANRYLVFTNLGYVALKQNNTQQAATYFQQALGLEPDFMQAHQALLDLRSKQQQWQQAERHWYFLRNARVHDEATLNKALIVVQNTGNHKEERYIQNLLSNAN